MDHSPPCGERFNANGGETQPLLLSRSTSGSDVSNSPKLPVPESSSARYGSSLASASASVNHNIHFPEQASDDLFNPQSGHTVATGFSTFKSGVPPSDTSQETTGDPVHVKLRTRKPKDGEHFVSQEPPVRPGAGRHTCAINNGENKTVAMAEGYNPYRCVNICLFGVISFGFFLFLLIPSISMGTVASIYKCQDYEVTAIVYPGDIILAAETTDCQWNTAAVLKRVGSPRNEIDVYIAPCDAVKVHSEEKNYTSIMFPEIHYGQTVIGLNSNNFSNYFGKNSSVSLAAQMGSNDSMEAFMCIYDNATLFGSFLNPDSEEHFLQSMELALECEKIQLVPYSPYNYDISIKFTDNGYYFVGISPSYSDALSFLQFNLSVWRNFYNRSDFLEDLINCPLSSTGSNCSANNTYSSTCTMLYASVSIDDNYFNFVAIDAEGIPVHRRSAFIPVLAGSLCVGFAVFAFEAAVTIYIYNRCRKKISKRFNGVQLRQR